MQRTNNFFFAILLGIIASMLLVNGWQKERLPHSGAYTFVAPGDGESEFATSLDKPTLHPLTIRQPKGPPRVRLAETDPQGRSGEVACSTCHGVRPANHENRTSATLDEFHQGLQFNHGNLACYACHNPDDADALRLADGSSVEYRDVMTLCAQCHGAQASSFANGAHGGMNGFWDRSRGPQTKNNCIDCHDPHVPSFPKMVVGFKPHDRFLDDPSNDPTTQKPKNHE